MTDEQIHDIVMGTLHAAISTGDIVGVMPDRQNEGMPMEAAPDMGAMQ